MKSTKLKMLTNGAMFAAIIFAATLTGSGGTHRRRCIHIHGDAAIYLAVLLLPHAVAVAAAAIRRGACRLYARQRYIYTS